MFVFLFVFVQRLTALKRAYADIILNTAKEAAARIMVSERKALRFQQELNVSKEQALQMLLRLKQMMDSKVNTSVLFRKRLLLFEFGRIFVLNIWSIYVFVCGWCCVI